MANETRRPVWRRLRCFAAFFAAGVLASGGTLILIWFSDRSPPLPPILQGLHWSLLPAYTDEFSQRLGGRFPVGSSESALIRELWTEGFLPRTDLHAPKHDADIELSLFPCRHNATVSWSADDAGRITAISGLYYYNCL